MSTHTISHDRDTGATRWQTTKSRIVSTLSKVKDLFTCCYKPNDVWSPTSKALVIQLEKVVTQVQTLRLEDPQEYSERRERSHSIRSEVAGRCISPSMNTPVLPRKEEVRGFEQMVKVFGAPFVSAHAKVAQELKEVLNERLEDVAANGVCGASCFLFVSQFLRSIQSGSGTWLQYIHLISTRFSWGAPEEAQIAQNLSKIQKLMDITEEIIDDQQLLRDYFQQSLQSFFSVYDLEGTVSLPQKTTKDGLAASLEKQMEALSVGPHIFIMYEEGWQSGHAMVYIKKSSEVGFLFDPNFATMAFTKSVENRNCLFHHFQKHYSEFYGGYSFFVTDLKVRV